MDLVPITQHTGSVERQTNINQTTCLAAYNHIKYP